MRRYPFVTVDVFTSKPLEGNPLAVFTDARGLGDREMQALALEMNLSETTFVFPRNEAIERERGVQVRIFNIASELPFAGHPTLGTAFVLAEARRSREIVLDLKVGRIPVRFEDRDGAVFGEMIQRDPEFGQIHNPQQVAQASGVPVDSIDPSFPMSNSLPRPRQEAQNLRTPCFLLATYRRPPHTVMRPQRPGAHRAEAASIGAIVLSGLKSGSSGWWICAKAQAP
jgi:predicted PhzF superfamily epimerase YddE/YHI9